MLPKRHRLHTSAEFSVTIRSGARSGRRNLVLYAHCVDSGGPSRFGFIVSRAVGNAVTRNLVKRRLREVSARVLEEYPCGVDIVVRALPTAAAADWLQLSRDFRKALGAALDRAGTRASRSSPTGRPGDGRSDAASGKEGTA